MPTDTSIISSRQYNEDLSHDNEDSLNTNNESSTSPMVNGNFESGSNLSYPYERNLESCDTEISYLSNQSSTIPTFHANLGSRDTEIPFLSNLPSTENYWSKFDRNLRFPMVGRNFESLVPMQLPFLQKSIGHEAQNVTTELFINHGTQTLEAKPCNMTDIFGQRYQYSCSLNRNNRTLSWERSDCKLTLPSSAVEEHNVEVHTSTFDDIPAICEKMSLSPDTRISSPVVEYRLTDNKKLDDYALVEIPYVGAVIDIEIWKCPSDSGMHQTLERVKVPVLEKEKNEYDCFCIVEKGKARVYTKSFSVFFCTKHQTERNDFCLQAFLFGSFKKILDKYEVTLSLYIADELHKFTDYNQVSIYQYIPGYFVIFCVKHRLSICMHLCFNVCAISYFMCYVGMIFDWELHFYPFFNYAG